jgi:hypothetical protein
MGRLDRRPNPKVPFFLSVAVAYLAAGSAIGACNVTGPLPPGTVPCKVVVQPIDVCVVPFQGFQGPPICAPFNQNSVIGNPSDQNQITNPIGFIDMATGIDITRAMLNQIGVDVTFLPIVEDLSMDFATLELHVLDDANNTTCPAPGGTMSGFTSCDFLTLSQQPQISQDANYVPTSPLGGPTQDLTVINMFFVSHLQPPPSQMGGTLYGFSWINNNGIAIGGDAFFPPVSMARFDTLAHELGHNLALTHMDFGALNPPPNLMAMGGTPSGDFRIVPSSTGFEQPPPLPGGALYLIGTGMADQLTLTMPGQPSQQDQVLMSGLLRDVPDSTLTAMTPGSEVASAGSGSVVAAAATAGDSFGAVTKPRSNTSIDFAVSGAVSAGNPDESLTALILMLPKGLRFDPRNRFHAYFNSQHVAETEILYWDKEDKEDKENGFCVNPTNFGQISDRTHEHHRGPVTECLLIEFKQPGLQKGQTVRFRIGISIGGAPITIDELAGGDVTFIFGSDTYATTSALTGPVSGQLMAGSQQPDLRVPSRYVDPSRVLPTGNPPCTVEVDTSLARRPTLHHTTGCPDPRMTGIEDGDPSHEGGQPPLDPYGRQIRR